MTIAKWIKTKKQAVDNRLAEVLPDSKIAPGIIHRAMRYAVLNGGKRIRPIYAISTCKTMGGKLRDVLDAACAIELIHSYSLIHDDLPAMDDAPTRRGKPSCHKKFGEAIAILAGDALLTLAFRLLSGGPNPKRNHRFITELSEAAGTTGMIGGQVVDLDLQSSKKIKPAKLEYASFHKTASLIASSFKIGALSANAPERKIKVLFEFGRNLGMAFQVFDDIKDRDGYFELLGNKGAKQKAEYFIGRARNSLKRLNRPVPLLTGLLDLVGGDSKTL